ncbi:rho guanine nucleotide exchange factor 19 [Chanos chanos]|uniref:Rho guanine nucleotide exchange factor 19 n=1 Tax=Chanos chanos TaxID=29144 RepID=A0A6J2WAD9_CHACN|nr:rho guanine nucleotide exchange factor 19-like [Chanos chanos]
MWLEPRQGRERASSSLEDEFAEKERSRYTFADRYRERESVREEEQERYADRQSGEREKDRKRPEDWYRERERAGEFVWDEKKERENERRRGVGRKDNSAERGSDAEYGNEPNWQGDREGQTERENATDNTEESDREEEEGEGGYGRYEESEDGSEDVWEGEGERERAAATDDGFVTVSSGGEGEDEYEEKFEDCAEFWDTGVTAGQTHRANETQGEPEGEGETKQGTEEEKADETVTVFCLIGQTNLTDRMTEGEANQHSGLDNNAANADQEIELNAEKHPGNDSEKDRDNSSQGTEEKREGRSGATSTSMEETKEKDYNPKEQETQAYEDMTPSENPKASANERTGTESELHPPEHPEGPEDCGRDVEDEKTTAQAVRSEQREDGEGRMEEHFQVEETWTTAEERKRQSGPPHLKWAKNVIREYLGSSEEGVLAVPESADPPTDVPPGQSQAEAKEEGAETPIYAAVDKTAKHKRRVDSDPLPGVTEKEKGNQEHTHLDTHLQTESEREADGEALLIPGEGEPEMEEDLEDYRGGMEGETDEEWDSDKVALFKHDKQYLSSDQLTHSSEGESEKEGGKKEKKEKKKKGGWSIISSNSFRDLGSEARTRRKGFRKTTERKREEEESGEGVGRDRRPIVLNTSEDDDEDHLRFSWGEVDIRNVTDTLGKMRKRNSKFYNAQLYQQYSEVVQNREILRQSRSDAISMAGDVPAVAPPPPSSPAPSSSPPPACRPLPPIPHVPHPHSLSHSNSFSSVSSLPVPTSAGQGGSRPPSPRLSVSSLSQSPTLWQDLPGVRNTPELAALTEDERRLQEVRFEMVTSEASYCRSLDIVVEHFVKSKPLNSLLGSQDRNWLFSRLGDVRAISHRFLAKLEEKVENDVMGFTVCDVIIEHSQRFRMVYVPYLTNQSYQDKTYQRLMDENAGFRRVVEKLERSPLCQRLPLRSFLILPFQRITRLKLLVQNIAKRTAPKTKDESQAIKAMKLLEKIIQDGNDSINQMKSIESLVSLSAKVDFECKTLPLISQSRRLVREGPVTELRDFSAKEKERSAYLHLFNDYMLLSLCKEGGRFTVIDHAPVSDLRAENCRVKLHSLQKNLFVLYMGNKSLLVRADTQSDKLRWISALSRPHPEIDFTAAQDFAQMQCIRAFVAQQPDELTLEKADVLLVHQQSSDGWVEGTRLSDRQRGWAPESHLEIISSQRARKRNLQDALKISNATAAV